MSMSAASEQIMHNEMMRVRKSGKYSPRESNYMRLFGTLERVAQTLADIDCIPIFSNCELCPLNEPCNKYSSDESDKTLEDVMLEWLKGDTRKED